jgi:hypothetical protein
VSSRYYLEAFTAPAGTPASAPAAFPWTLENGKLNFIQVRIPDGHSGLTGIRFKWSTAVVIPTVGNLFLVANAEVVTIPWDDEIAEDALTVEVYNTDVWDHVFYLRASVSDLATGPAVVTPDQAAPGATPDTVTADVASLADTGPPPPPEDTSAAEPPLPVSESDLSDVIT